MANRLLSPSVICHLRSSLSTHNPQRNATRVVRSVMASGTVELSITNKIQAALKPSYMKVINESYMHNVPPQSETHFKIVVVSDLFTDVPLIKRHRLVNEALSEELNSGVHALSIVAKTPAQWEDGPKEVEKSPACRGGFGK